MSRRRWPVVLAIVAAFLVLTGVILLVLWGLGAFGGGSRVNDDRPASVIGAAEGSFVHIDAGAIEEAVGDKDDALDLLSEIGPSMGISDAQGTLADPNVQDGLGNSFYRFGQVYEGIPVYGRSVVVGAGEQGDVIGVTGNYLPIEGLGTTPAVSSESAVQTALAGHEGATASSQGLCVYSLDDVAPTLAWQIDVSDGFVSTRMFVNASTGAVITEVALYDTLTSVTGTDVNGNDVVLDVQDNGDGTIALIDESRNIRGYFGDGKNVTLEDGKFYDENGREIPYIVIDDVAYPADESGNRLESEVTEGYTFNLFDANGNVIATGVSNTFAPPEAGGETLAPLSGAPSILLEEKYSNLVTLYGYLADAIDYYRTNLNRDSYNGYGGPVHLVSDCSLRSGLLPNNKNAFTDSRYNGSMIRYGKDLPIARTSLAHEFTHSVVYTIADLGAGSEGPSQAQVLKEAICDLMGVVIDDFSNDGDFDNDASWDIPQVRNLADPENSDGGKKHLPAAYEGKYWKDTLEIHDASTVISHAGYLMCNGDLEGAPLTTEQLGQLVYVTLFSLPQNCNFSQFRVIMENACYAMIGQGLLEPGHIDRVSAAFDEVNVKRTLDFYGLTKDATLQVFDVNNEPYGDYVAYVGPWKEHDAPSPGDKDVYTVTPASSDPVALNFPKWGKYQIEVKNLGGLKEGEEPYESWSATVSVGFFRKSKELKLYTSFSERDEESAQGEVIESLPQEPEGPASDETPATTAPGTRDVALVLDVSGSMSGEPISQMKDAARGFLDTALEGGAQVGLVSYSDQAQVHQGLGSNASVLTAAVDGLSSGGNTNIEDGLVKGGQVLSGGQADRRIYVLMSDGAPNEGKVGDELIAYADELKERGDKIYTVGFNEGAEGYALLSQMASDGCHYEVRDANDLAGFFSDIADEISGTRFVYARVACPVDVEVRYGGETLSSNLDEQNLRTSFGTLAFEDEVDAEGNIVEENGIKVLRLREGPAYDLEIEGTGKGEMDYTLGLANEEGDYEDFRTFEAIEVTPSMRAITTAEVAGTTRLEVDEDGDGVFDAAYVASANETASKVDNHVTVYLTLVGCVVVAVGATVCVRGISRWRESRSGMPRAA